MRRTVTLSSQVHRVLKNVLKGSTLRARRTFPFPHEYILSKPDGTGDFAGRMAVDTIASLLEHRLMEAHLLDALGDNVRYALTDAGRDVGETGTLAYDDQNAEMFG